jgi:hypothetical protein
MEQRANIKFYFQAGERAPETFQLIKRAYGDTDNVLCRTRVLGWYEAFRDCRENLEDEHTGRPSAIQTPDMIETFLELISAFRQMTFG